MPYATDGAAVCRRHAGNSDGFDYSRKHFDSLMSPLIETPLKEF